MRIAPLIQVTEPERQQLAQWARGRRTPARLVLRAKIILLAAEGHDNQHIATALGTSRQTVGLWRHRVATQRLPGLAQDSPRGGRPPKPAPFCTTIQNPYTPSPPVTASTGLRLSSSAASDRQRRASARPRPTR